MCADWIRTQFDQVHPLYAQLTDESGGLDIPPGTAVVFSGVLVGDSAPSIGGAGVVVRPGATPDDPNRGFVRYDLLGQDTANAGIFLCQWKLTPPGYAFHQSFPEDSFMTFIVIPSV